MVKSPKQLERYCKGVSNHRRIQIIELLHRVPGLNMEAIADELKCNQKTISGHTFKLVTAGLLNKTYQGKMVLHTLSPYGEKFYKFLNSFE